MKSLLKIIVIAAVAGVFTVSCSDEYGARKESTPVIQSADVSPTSFTFGDRVTLSAQITDPATALTTLEYTFISGGKTIATGVIPINEGQSATVSQQILVPLTSEQPDNAPVTVTLTAKNILKGVAGMDVTGLTGKRPVYSRLYLVTEDGSVVTLTPQAANKDKYEATGLTLDRAFNYRIAEKLTDNQQIDYDGAVWGNVNGRLAMIDSNGETAFVFAPNSGYMQSFTFDNYGFSATATGSALSDDDLIISDFSETTYGGEDYLILPRNLVKGHEYMLIGKLANEQIIYHLDFFERTAPNKIKFLGETGVYTLNYNTYRQYIIVSVEDPDDPAYKPAYPDYLLITGGGIGYPTKVLSGGDRATCWWGFGDPRNFILMRKIADDTFQATFFIHDDGSWTSFKPFENGDWSGDGGFSTFTVTGEDVFEPNGDDNWTPKADFDSEAVYRITIHWAAKTAHVEKVIL